MAAPSSASSPPGDARRRRAHLALAACCLVLLCLPSALVARADGEVTVHVFTREGCPHCERATSALARILAAREGVARRRYDIARDPAHRRLLIDVSRALGLDVG